MLSCKRASDPPKVKTPLLGYLPSLEGVSANSRVSDVHSNTECRALGSISQVNLVPEAADGKPHAHDAVCHRNVNDELKFPIRVSRQTKSSWKVDFDDADDIGVHGVVGE